MSPLLSALISAAAVITAVTAVALRPSGRTEARAALKVVADSRGHQTVTTGLLGEAPAGPESSVLRATQRLGRLSPPEYLTKLRLRLARAGFTTPAAFDRFMTVRVLTILGTPFALALPFVLHVKGALGPIAGLLLLAVFVLGPEAALDGRVTARQERIAREVPELIDLLTVSVEAGLGFDQALARATSTLPGALSDELLRVLAEVRMGHDRQDAFAALDQRTDVPQLRSFIAALNHAERFGVSIAEVLRSQAEESRITRRQLAQEKAHKAPVKMMIPLVFCIMPSLFVVVLGPAAIQIYRTVIR